MQQITKEAICCVIYIAKVHFSHLPFRDLNTEVLVPPKCTWCFYGILSHRYL